MSLQLQGSAVVVTTTLSQSARIALLAASTSAADRSAAGQSAAVRSCFQRANIALAADSAEDPGSAANWLTSKRSWSQRANIAALAACSVEDHTGKAAYLPTSQRPSIAALASDEHEDDTAGTAANLLWSQHADSPSLTSNAARAAVWTASDGLKFAVTNVPGAARVGALPLLAANCTAAVIDVSGAARVEAWPLLADLADVGESGRLGCESSNRSANPLSSRLTAGLSDAVKNAGETGFGRPTTRRSTVVGMLLSG